MKDIKIVIFDCDGVMFDTVKANTAYYNRILSHLGKPPLIPDQFDFVHMHTADESIAYLSDNEDELKAAQNYRKIIGYDEFIRYMEIEPYLKHLLQWLKPNYRRAIATNRSDTMPRVISEFNLEDDFDMVVTALDVENPKPAPDQLFKILNHFKINPGNALYVGDSKVDETAAKAAGVPLAAYNNHSLSADFHITSLNDIKDILNDNPLRS